MISETYSELISRGESCKTSRKYKIEDYDECPQIFKEFRCPNGRGRNLYSFFTVGKVSPHKP